MSGWEGWIPQLSAYFFLLILLLRAGEDADTWFHLSAGRWIWTHGEIPWADPFSLVSAYPYLDSHWLFQVLLYPLHRLGGIGLLVLTQAAVFLTAFRVLETSLETKRLGAAWTLLFVLTVISVEQRFLIRPDMATFLFLAIYWRILFSGEPLTERRIALICLCQALWVNMHGLFAIGLVGIFCSIVGGLIEKQSRKKLAALGIGSLIACFITPYGVGLVGYAFKIFGEIGASSDPFMRALTELQSPFTAYRLEPDILVFYSVSALTLVSIALNARKLHIGPALWIVGLAYLSWSARRNAAYFVFLAVPFAAQNLLSYRKNSFPHSKPVSVILAGLIFVGAWFVASGRYYANFGRLAEFGVSRNPFLDPSGALVYAEKANLKGNFFNDYAFGGPIMHRWSPKRKVFVDGRWEVYGMPFLKRYTEVTRSPAALWDAYAREFDFKFAILHSLTPVSSELISYLTRHPDWNLVYADPMASLFAREGKSFTIPAPPIPTAKPSLWTKFWKTPFPIKELAFGRFAYFTGDAPGARAWFKSALRIDPLSPDAHFNLGTLAYQTGDREAALAHYYKALELDATSSSARNAIATVHLSSGKTQEAMVLLRQSTRLDPGDADAWKLLGTARARSGDFTAAIAALKRAVKIDPRNKSFQKDLETVKKLESRTP